MKERLIANCEKTFVQNAILQSIRVDGRSLDEFRKVRINFGSDWGLVHVALGDTKALARVTCEIVQPKATRPNEGTLFINTELGLMSAPHFEIGRQSDESVQLNRILERALKDSGCVDLESLCLVAEDKVWNLRVDINVLNHEGNVIDCCAIAALTALAHFRRPDITVDGENVIIHTPEEKDPIKITLFHYPVCVSYAIFNKGAIAVADPTALEQRVAEAKIVFGINSYGELCGLHLGGITLTSSDLLLRTSKKASLRAKVLVEKIKAAIQQDAEDREKGVVVGFSECIEKNQITSHAQDRIHIRLKRFKLNKDEHKSSDEEEEENQMDDVHNDHAEISDNDEKPQNEQHMDVDDENAVIPISEDAAVLLPKCTDGNQWIQEEELLAIREKSKKKRKTKKKKSLEAISRMNDIQNSSGSEEDSVTLTSEQINKY